MIKEWSDIAWKEYEFFQNEDKKILRKINNLIKDIERNGESVGIGEPEPLKYEWSGYYWNFDTIFQNEILRLHRLNVIHIIAIFIIDNNSRKI